MDKAYQIVAQFKEQPAEVLETVNSREEAEYAVASYMLEDVSKDYTMQIVEVGRYAYNKI